MIWWYEPRSRISFNFRLATEGWSYSKLRAHEFEWPFAQDRVWHSGGAGHGRRGGCVTCAWSDGRMGPNLACVWRHTAAAAVL